LTSVGPCAVSDASFFFTSRRRHTRWPRDWSSDVCSSDLFSRSIFLSRRTPSRTNRSLGLAPTDLFDGYIQVAQEVRRDVSLRVRVGARGHRDATGERSRDGAPLPFRRAVDQGMLE